MSELRERLEMRAAELGFARLGVAEVGSVERDAAALRAWIEAGYHGSMRWMAESEPARADPRALLPTATRVVALVTPYARAEPASGPSPGVLAAYARGRDYHNVVGKRLRKLVSLLRDAGHEARAGVGFIGKNCCLIVPGLGSHVFLATVLTDAPLPVDAPMAPRCGSCRACLDACPTDAFVAPRELDARRCISYLTIEHAGEVDPSLREGLGGRLFGCDVCQDVCPFNRTAAPDPRATEPFAPRDDPDAAAVLAMDDAAHLAWAHGRPLRRAGRDALARNAALVLGNRGERRHLPVLERAAQTDADPAVRDAAAWAAARVRERES